MPSPFLLLLVAPAWAQDAPRVDLAEEADLEFQRGVRDYRAGHYEDALEHLLASNRLVPNKNVVLNIALACENLERWADAYRHYSDYLDAETDPDQRAAVEKALARLAPRVALLRVETDPPGATLFVDRKELGPRGATPRILALDPGVHKVFVHLDGYHDAASERLDLILGQTAEASFELDRLLGTVQLVTPMPPGGVVHADSVDGPVLGVVDASGAVVLPVGSHVVAIAFPGDPSHRSHPFTVDVVADAQVKASVPLEEIEGSLRVTASQRDADVWIDGTSRGYTPLALPIGVGPHRVRVGLDGFPSFEQDITVTEGNEAFVFAPLVAGRDVTAASRAAESAANAPASVSVIPGIELRTFGYETVQDALIGTRGLYATYDHSYEYVGVRGVSRLGNYNNRNLMTLDGHTVNDDQLGASYFGHDVLVDLQDLAQIEVVRGPGSALYGTNAFSGVVNLVTRDGDRIRPTHVAVGVVDPRSVRARAGWSRSFGDGGSAWLSAGALVGQGESIYPQASDGQLAVNAMGRVSSGDVTVEGYANSRRKAVPSVDDPSLGGGGAHTDDSRAFVEARWEPTIGERGQLYTRAWIDTYGYAGEFLVAEDREHGLPGGISTALWSGTWVGVEPRVVVSPVDALKLTFGATGGWHPSGRLTACIRDLPGTSCDEGPHVLTTTVDRQETWANAAAYGIVDASPAPWLAASVGGRVDWLSAVGAAFNPRVALILHPGQANTLKLLGGSAFRAPSPYERDYFDGIASGAPGDLAPERVWTVEAEGTHRFGEVVTATADAYVSRISQLIDVKSSPDGLDRYANGDGLATEGVELEVRRDWLGGWMLAANATLQRTRADGAPIANSPAQVWCAKSAVPVGPATLANRFVVESPRLTEAGAATAPVLRWDATLTGTIRPVRVDWTLGLRNVLGWEYAWPAGPDLGVDTVPQAGRSLVGGLTWEL
jgi:outer membrane receptor for ferrienterochelin and colicins